MAKIQFSFGNTKENTGMREVKTIYSSEIDGQAKQGGIAASSQDVKNQMKRSSVTIGTKLNDNNVIKSEANSQFVNKQFINNSQAQKDQKHFIASKVKNQNFTLREQKQGGLINNYFQTSHNQTFNSKGNPNEIRSRIPESTKTDGRKEHYYLGFDKSGFKPAMGQTYNFQS